MPLLMVLAFILIVLGDGSDRAVTDGLLRGPLAAPLQIPGVHTIQSAAAPPITLRLVSWGLLGGACVLIPSIGYRFTVFKGDDLSAFERVDTAEHERPA